MSKRRVLVLASALALLFMLAAPVAAGTTRTEYEGLETYDGPLSPGRQWVSEDGVLHIRGLQEAYTDGVDDPRLCGGVVVTVNANFHLVGPPVSVYGPMWGTLRIDNDDGYWEGSWVGKRTQAEGFSFIRAVMHGHEMYEGLKAQVSYVRESPDPTKPFMVHGVLMDSAGG